MNYQVVNGTITEEELIVAAKTVAKKLAKKFAFSYHAPEDIEQEIYVSVMRVINKFDSSKSSLEGFIYQISTNRLINFVRDKQHPPCPCKKCQHRENGQTSHDNGLYCNAYVRWATFASARKNVANPANIEYHGDSLYDDAFFAQLENNDIRDTLMDRLNKKDAALYQKILDGEDVSKEDYERFVKKARRKLND